MLQHFDEQVFVQHRFAEHIRARVYPPAPGGLFIELNYSELRATLKQEGSSYNQPIILLFPQSIGQGAVFTPKTDKGHSSWDGRSRSTAVSSASPGVASSASARKGLRRLSGCVGASHADGKRIRPSAPALGSLAPAHP